jgi:hypothetical protein
MTTRVISSVLLLFAAASLEAGEPHPSFRAAGAGFFDFDTGTLRGRLKLDGRYQGVYPIVDVASQSDLTMPPGVFSPYRVFSTGRRYGDAARDWPTESRVRDDGAVEVRWPAAPQHPVALAAVYRWTRPDTLDVELTATSEGDLPAFELFVSSYLLHQELPRGSVPEARGLHGREAPFRAGRSQAEFARRLCDVPP